MATVLITGGTGMIGTALSAALVDKGYDVIILTRGNEQRHKKVDSRRISYALWNPSRQEIDLGALAKADYIIHLAGAGIADKRWSRKRKQEIIDSRVKSGELLAKVIREQPNHVKVLVSASAIGWYGPDPIIPNPHPFTENDPSYQDFLGQSCRLWEESTSPIRDTGRRVVKLRTGIVLSKKGGALDEFRKPLRFGIATILGNGNQVISWIHIDDLVRLYIHAIEHPGMNGSYNAVAPFPVSNRKFVLELAKSLKGKFFVPLYIPSFVLKLVLGEMSIEVLKSATVSCEKTRQAGFTFLYPSIEAAFQSLAARDK